MGDSISKTRSTVPSTALCSDHSSLVLRLKTLVAAIALTMSGPAGFASLTSRGSGTTALSSGSNLDLNVSSLTLSGAGRVTSLVDLTPGVFSFSNLVAGSYQLNVSGTVTKGKGFDDILPLPVGYAGSLTTNAAVTPVPEPETYAMLLLGLGTVGWMARRRKKV